MTRTFSAGSTNVSYALTGMTATAQRQFNLYQPTNAHVTSWIAAAGGVPCIIRLNYTNWDTSTKSSTAISSNTDWRHAALRSGCQIIDATVSLGTTTAWKPFAHPNSLSIDSAIPEIEIGRLIQFLRLKRLTYFSHPKMLGIRGNSGSMDVSVVRALGNDLASPKQAIAAGSDAYLLSSRPNCVMGAYANVHWPSFASSVSGGHFQDEVTGGLATTIASVVKGDKDSLSIPDIVTPDLSVIPPISSWYEDTPVSEVASKWKTDLPPKGAFGAETNGHSALGGLQLKKLLGSKFILCADDSALFATDNASMMVDYLHANSTVNDTFNIDFFLNEVVAKIPRKDAAWTNSAVDSDDLEMLVPPSIYPRDIVIQNLQEAAATGKARLWNARSFSSGMTLKLSSGLSIVTGGLDTPLVLKGITGAIYAISVDAVNKAQLTALEIFGTKTYGY